MISKTKNPTLIGNTVMKPSDKHFYEYIFNKNTVLLNLEICLYVFVLTFFQILLHGIKVWEVTII